MRNENVARILPLLVGDAKDRLESLVAAVDTFGPFGEIFRIVYLLAVRIFIADDLAESPELLNRTLALFKQVEAASLPSRIIFPWLPTVAYLKRKAAGMRLYIIFDKIV
jgi:hypothetical protein